MQSELNSVSQQDRRPCVVVTGGAGFIGSWLCERLLREGKEVVAVDNLATGSVANVLRCAAQEGFHFVEHDVTHPFWVPGPVETVFHLAALTPPLRHEVSPVEALRVGSLGTENALRLAAEKGARFILASAAEVYGDPEVYPQHEDYPGNVNPIGPRSMYDESKRYAEALVSAYRTERGVDTGIARIFSTYGPRMATGDDGSVSTFIEQALAGRPIEVVGDGGQTRSLCYVSDTVEALVRLAASSVTEPVNVGGEAETTVLELAETVRVETGSSSPVELVDRPAGDLCVRWPDLTRARAELDWSPTVSLSTGLAATIASRGREGRPVRQQHRVEALPQHTPHGSSVQLTGRVAPGMTGRPKDVSPVASS